MNLPLEFIPPTIVLIVAAVVSALVWLHKRLNERPVEVPHEFTMADLEAAWKRTAPMREAALHAQPYNVEEDGM